MNVVTRGGSKRVSHWSSKLNPILLSFLCQMYTTQGTDSGVVMNQQRRLSKVKEERGNSLSTKKKSNEKWRQQSKQLREVTDDDCVIVLLQCHFEMKGDNRPHC